MATIRSVPAEDLIAKRTVRGEEIDGGSAYTKYTPQQNISGGSATDVNLIPNMVIQGGGAVWLP